MAIMQLVVSQNRATNKLICVVHTVCMTKACSQGCLSTALFFLHVQHIVRLRKQMGSLLFVCFQLKENITLLNLRSVEWK